MKKLLSIIVLFTLLLQNIHISFWAEDLDDHPWVISDYLKDINDENFKNTKISFLVEWLDKNLKIKRDTNGYTVWDMLKNSSFKNINSWLEETPDFWHIRLDTPSSSNIASYFPSSFNYNVPYKIYELDWNLNKSNSWELIYSYDDKQKMCVLWFSRSIDEANDFSTKMDIYWLSEDWKWLIWKDYRNTKTIEIFNTKYPKDIFEAKDYLKNNNKYLLLKDNWKEITRIVKYDTTNFDWMIENGMISSNMKTKYWISFQNLWWSSMEFEQFSEASWSWKDFNLNIEPTNFNLKIINNNRINEVENAFILHKDLIYWFLDKKYIDNNQKLSLFEEIYKKNLKDNIKSYYINKFQNNSTNKTTEIMILQEQIDYTYKYLNHLWIEANKKDLAITNPDTIVDNYISNLEKFLSTVKLNFKLNYIDNKWNYYIYDDYSVLLDKIVASAESSVFDLWFYLFDKDGKINPKINSAFTISSKSLFPFPTINTDSWIYSLWLWFVLNDEYLKDPMATALYDRVIVWKEYNALLTWDKWVSLWNWLHELMMNIKPFSINYRYTTPEITDFIAKNFVELRNYTKYSKVKDLIKDLFLKIDFFTDWKPYKLKDITWKSKVTTKKPYVYPISYILSKDNRQYSWFSTKNWDNSILQTCLAWPNYSATEDLLEATPESDIYKKIIEKNWKKYLISYKVLQIQFKFAWDLSFWKDSYFFSSIPNYDSLNVWTFANTNPIKDYNNIKIESFLSWEDLNLWSWFSKTSDTYSYWYRVFTPNDTNIIKYNEAWAWQRIWDSSYYRKSYQNSITKIDWETFGDWDWTVLAKIWTTNSDDSLANLKKQEKFIWDEFNYNWDSYLSPACPTWYSLYDDYLPVYKELYDKKYNISDNMKTLNFGGFNTNEKYSLLDIINQKELITWYFNTPKPFCVHDSIIKDKDSIIKYIKQMLISDVSFYPDAINNPFLLETYNWNYFSPVYLNTLKWLFVSVNNDFPDYWRYSEKNKEVIENAMKNAWMKNYDFFSNHKDYTWKKGELINNIILNWHRTESNIDSNIKSRLEKKKSVLWVYLWDLDHIYYSAFFGLNLLKTWGDPFDFSPNINWKIFPIIGSVMNIRKSWIDFYCKNINTWEKTNSIIINWKCLNKNTKTLTNDELVYINNWSEQIKEDWAFINNTYFNPLFKKGSLPIIPYTSWNLYSNISKNNQWKLPFINNPTFSSWADDFNLKPRVIALKGEFSNTEDSKSFYADWYWVKNSWFHSPFAFKMYFSINDFWNLVSNAKIDNSELLQCKKNTNWKISYSPYNNWCPDWWQIVAKDSLVNYLINKKSNSIGERWNDYEVLWIPTKIWSFLNADIIEYTNKNILNNKAELIWWKKFSYFYIWDDDYSNFENRKQYNEQNLFTENSSKYDYERGWNFIFVRLNNTTTWMNNNSVYYSVKWEYLNEACLFGNSNLNSCVYPYNTFEYEILPDEWTSNWFNEWTCIEKDWTKRTYDPVKIDENDINRTWYCNDSCIDDDWVTQIFSNDLYYNYKEKPEDLSCRWNPSSRIKIFDGFSLNNFLKNNSKTENLWAYRNWINGNGWSLNSWSWNCIYSTSKNQQVKCYEWFLSKYNFEINKESKEILKENPWLVNGYNYVDNDTIWKKVSHNYNSIFNNDLVVLNNKTNVIDYSHIFEGWYIWYNSDIIDNITWWIKNPYIFSDNDNLKGEWEATQIINTTINSSSKDLRQQRRETIKEQIKLSAWTSNDIISNPTSWLNFISFKLNKDDFYSLNWILRISKDSTRYFSNFKVQDPDNEEYLLNSKNVLDTIYSYNNLIIKYWDKFYTWWNNDTSCNWINPNEVFNRIDAYSNISNNREDTITACLKNTWKLTDKHTLDNNIYVIIPIKPTKWYNKYSIDWIVENDNPTNSTIAWQNWYINWTLNQKDASINLNTYFQWYFTNSLDSLDSQENFLNVSNWSKITNYTDNAVKWRSIELRMQTNPKTCSYRKCWNNDCRNAYVNYNEYRLTWENSYNTKFFSNKIKVSRLPKIFLNWFITRTYWKDRSINAFETSISKTQVKYSWISGSQALWTTSWRSPLDYASCTNISSWVWQAQDQVMNDWIYIANIFNQNSITFWWVTTNSSQITLNKGNKIDIFNIPDPKDDNEYKNNINYSTIIKDKYIKSWNFNDSVWVMNNNWDFVYWSLKENSNKVSIGDYLDFETTINVSWDIIPQLFFFKTQLDRWLDMDISTLEIEKNNWKQSPIYLDTKENKDFLENLYNSQFIISKINQSWNVLKNVKYMVNENFDLQKDQKITTTKWKVYLQLLNDVKVNWSKWIEYWDKNWTTYSQIFNKNNWIVTDNDYSDVFTDIWSYLKKDNIVVVNAWEYVKFNSNIQVKVLGYNFIPNFMLGYNIDKISLKDPLIWISPLNSWFGDLKINPSVSQPYYIFKCNELENKVKFTTNATYLEIPWFNWEYCWVYNKYSDNVYAWYLNQINPYKLNLPWELYRFMYSDNDENGKLLNTKYIDSNNRYLTKNNRWTLNEDTEKRLIVNLGILKKWDLVKVKYKAKVNKYNYNGHILYNYDYNKSKGISSWINKTDSLLTWNTFSDNSEIYSQALNSQLFYLTNYWLEKDIYDKSIIFEDNNSIKWNIQIVPNIDLSLVNLSWRKDYYSCNPITEAPGICDKLNTIENVNRDAIEEDWLWKATKKPWEAQFIIHKWQKFIIRANLDNLYYKDDIKNWIWTINLKLAYDTNLSLFDWIILENSFYKNSNNIITNLNQAKKINIKQGNLSSSTLDLLNSPLRYKYVPKIWNDLFSSYKEINYSLLINSSNYKWKTVDFMFTAKNTFNPKEIKEFFNNAYIKDLNWLFFLSYDYTRLTNKIDKYLINDDYYAFTLEKDYNWTLNINLNNQFKYNPESTNSNTLWSKSFIYSKLPFSWEYKFLDSRFNITELMPTTANLETRIVNKWWDYSWVYKWTSEDWELFLEIELINTNKNNISILDNWLNISLPNWFWIDNVEYSYIDNIKSIQNKVITSNLANSKISYATEFWKRVYNIGNSYKLLIPWERIKYLVKLNYNMSLVDLISVFNTNINIANSDWIETTLFWDTQMNFEKWLWDLSIKSIPIFAENDVFFGRWFYKNKINSDSLINSNNWESNYNVIASSGTYIEYIWNKAKNYNLQWNIEQKVYNLNKILDEKQVSYSIVDYSSWWDPYLLNDLKLKNNTLYYFGDRDVYIWNYNSELWVINVSLSDNDKKNRFSWTSIFTKWIIYINQNINISKPTSRVKNNQFQNIWFIWQEIRINPRVSNIQWIYSVPLNNNAFLTKENWKSKYSWYIGIFRSWYSNNPLNYKGSIIAWMYINERKINSIINEENITEKGTFDNDLYIALPPGFRKE